jgi:hypothetical protein
VGGMPLTICVVGKSARHGHGSFLQRDDAAQIREAAQ